MPSTEMRTSTIGPTAMNPSEGCRSVTQKKMERMPRAMAMVVLIASVYLSVIWSVTATEVMLPEVAVIALSSPDQSPSISSWIILVCLGLPR